ncbi:energy transducer TonB [Chryseobacterium sp. MIQD13]|uniref:energy transducer TonB n=1 Tax=Chryseobacterium sp. MIQD13 TaxID=3422310 RepID=UPI003D2A7A57
MKVFTLFIALLVANFTFAQQDVEDRDDNQITETNKNLLKIDIKEPLLQVAVKNCNDFKPAAFEGGVVVYKDTLQKFMYDYLNSDFYVLNGDFTFTLTIDKTGKVTNIEGTPKVANSSYFFDDMKYVVRRIKKSWTPASCDGQPVTSQIKLKMNLSSMATDL